MDGKGVFLPILDFFACDDDIVDVDFSFIFKVFFTHFLYAVNFFILQFFLFRGVRPTANIFKLETFFGFMVQKGLFGFV